MVETPGSWWRHGAVQHRHRVATFCSTAPAANSCHQLPPAASCRVSAVSSPQLGTGRTPLSSLSTVPVFRNWGSGDTSRYRGCVDVVTWHVCQCSCVAEGCTHGYTLHRALPSALHQPSLSLYLGTNQTLPSYPPPTPCSAFIIR